MNQVTDIEEFDYTRTVIFSPEVTEVNLFPSDILSKKIAKLEEEAAIRMAIDTFLDCSEVKVKVGRACKPRPSEKVINRYTAA
jgi:hypothetical protein